MRTPLGPFPEADGFARATALDRDDELSEFKDRYVIEDPELIYLDGNSLGRLPRVAAEDVARTVNHGWGDRLVRSWNEGWWDLHLEVGDRLAPLLGASAGEVILSDSTSVNLYKLAMAAMKARPGRSRIVTDDLNFPTDVYVLQGVAEATRSDLKIVAGDGLVGAVPGLERAIDEETALVSLSHTTFKSGFTYDMAAVTELAHLSGALMLWDLSHSAGVMPMSLNRADVDLAVGCTYKYLNGGPGAPAFLYVRSDLHGGLSNPITAWWGHAEPFAFDLDFRPIEGIRKFHTGTLPIISVSAVVAGVVDVTEAGLARIREKSIALGEFLVELWEEHLEGLGFGLASPRDPSARGSHVSLSHPEAWPIARALVEEGKVIPDFRAPDNLRLGLSPLYTSFLDVHTAMLRLRAIVEGGHHHAYTSDRLRVT